jgi:uncharacterized protein
VQKLEDPILLRVRKALTGAFGDRIERLVLYGSRARGDARTDSDYDVALFLHDLDNPWSEMDQIARIELLIMDETEAFIHTTPFPAGAWASRTTLMGEIRREGLDL